MNLSSLREMNKQRGGIIPKSCVMPSDRSGDATGGWLKGNKYIANRETINTTCQLKHTLNEFSGSKNYIFV